MFEAYVAMDTIFVAIILLILAVWLFGAATLPFVYRRGPFWVRLLTHPAVSMFAENEAPNFTAAQRAEMEKWLRRIEKSFR